MFTHNPASRSIKVAFQGVTPSFDYSCVQFSNTILIDCAVSTLFK
ncbi:hypothetical protein BN191_810001 [Clostridioides difficile T61]|nr:hypothetical protein BN191_810001 [Clostridioides difficile T61]